jgi:hypothetical protein
MHDPVNTAGMRLTAVALQDSPWTQTRGIIDEQISTRQGDGQCCDRDCARSTGNRTEYGHLGHRYINAAERLGG